MNKFFVVLIAIIFLTVRICHAQTLEQMERDYNSYIKSHESKLAIDKAKEMSALINKNEGDTSLKFAISKKLIGNAYSNLNADSALYYYDLGLQLLKFQNRNRHVQAAKILYNEANIFYAKHDYGKYVALLNNAAEINRELEYPEFPFADWPLQKLYFYNVAMKNASQHERLLKERIGIFKKFNQTNTSDYANVCQSLGSHYITKGNLEEGEKYINESTQAFINTIGENNFNCASNYFWLGSISSTNQNYIKAETFFKKSIAILEDTLSKSDNTSPDNIVRVFYLACQDAMANFYYGIKNYENAQDIWTRLRKYYIEVGDTAESNSTTGNLAVAYIDNGEYSSALKLLMEQKIYNSDKSERNIESYLSLLQTLAIASKALDSSVIRSSAVREGVELSAKYFGKGSKQYLNAVKEKCDFLLSQYSASFFTASESKKEIFSYLGEYENLSKKLYEPSSRNYVDAIEQLAQFYNEIGDVNTAEKHYRDYNILLRKVNLPKDNSYFLNRLFYARFLLKIKKYDLAYNTISDLFSERLAYIQQNIFNLKEYERQLFWAKEEKYFDEYIGISSIVHSTVPQSPELAYNTVLLNKGLLLESTNDIQQSVLNSNDTNSIVLLRQLKSINADLANLFSSSYQGPKQQQRFKSNEDSIKMNELYFESDSIEQVLSRNMRLSTEYKKNITYTWRDVKSQLDVSEAAIEFTRYYNPKDSNQHYVALIILHNSSYPKLVNLCTEKELEKLSPENDFQKIYSTVWQPLEQSLRGIKKIYYSPVGILNSFSFNGIYKQVSNKRDYLLDKYDLNQLMTTRYLATGLKEKESNNFKPSIALFGDINYDELPDNIPTSRDNIDPGTSNFLKNLVAKNDDDKMRYGVSYLPATKKEIENIAAILTSERWDVSIFENRTATENRLKSFSGANSKSIIHIATHGFAFPAPTESNPEKKYQNNNFRFSDNPMIRSGLLFSGANLTWQGKGDTMLRKTNEDGILTAFELSEMCLEKTKLIVLSACETGKGTIYGSEGVMGLKRAIKLAGVENMIISLWKVDDEATMELMTLFYSEFAKNKNFVSSFVSAQKTMRNKYPEDPKKWAGFVFIR